MNTSYRKIFDAFYSRLESDTSFFNLYGLGDAENLEIADLRARQYLITAVNKFKLSCNLEINIQFDDEFEMLTVGLNDVELDIIVSLMHEDYYLRRFEKLNSQSVQFTPKDLQTYSVANERNSCLELYKYLQHQNELKIDKYASRDRNTFAWKMIDYASFDE